MISYRLNVESIPLLKHSKLKRHRPSLHLCERFFSRKWNRFRKVELCWETKQGKETSISAFLSAAKTGFPVLLQKLLSIFYIYPAEAVNLRKGDVCTYVHSSSTGFRGVTTLQWRSYMLKQLCEETFEFGTCCPVRLGLWYWEREEPIALILTWNLVCEQCSEHFLIGSSVWAIRTLHRP